MDSHDNKMDDDLFDEIIEFDDGVGGSDDKENQADRKGHKAKKAQMNKMKSFMAGKLHYQNEKMCQSARKKSTSADGLNICLFY